MSVNIDARGLACPQPVIATKKAIDNLTSGLVTTIVDNQAAKENVMKFAVANNCGVSVEEQSGHYFIRITKGEATDVPEAQPAIPSTRQPVYLITRYTLGHGSDELGTILMKSFLYALQETYPLPKTMMFMNSGVYLTAEGSPALDHLKELAAQGVQILSCGTCLDYYSLKEQLAVGEITNMYSILAEINGAARTITL